MEASPSELSRRQIRRYFESFRSVNATRASLLVGTDLAAYGVLMWLGLTLIWPGKVVIAILLGVTIARLFTLGHDAAHGSLFPSPPWNRVFAQILFLAPVVPTSLWVLGHNTIHHGFTNLKGRDQVWAPFSPDEWTKLRSHRRLLERFYRHPVGLGLYYLIELWWRTLYFPSLKHVAVSRAVHWRDSLVVTAFLAFQIAVVAIAAPTQASQNVIFLIVLPHFVWCWIMGFTVVIQHTHPDVRWYDQRAEWSYILAQVECVVHAQVPAWMNLMLHNIFEHTAHHIDTRIPCYQLPGAQRVAEALFGPRVTVADPWNWRLFVRHLKTCQLYDHGRHLWVRFP